MHLLSAQAGSIQMEGEAIDLGQTPGEIVLASAADSELMLLAGAADRAGYEGLRLASLLRLSHNMSVDLWLEGTVRHARLIVLRLLGGAGYWPYGVEQIETLARDRRIALALLPGDAIPDPTLRQRSTIRAADWDRLHALFVAGGPDNADTLLAACQDLATPSNPSSGAAPHRFPQGETASGTESRDPSPSSSEGGARRAVEGADRMIKPFPRFGYWSPAKGVVGELPKGVATVPILFYRAALEGAGTATLEALIAAVARQGMTPVPLLVSTLKEAACVRFVQRALAEHPPVAILNLTGFALGLDGLEDGLNPFSESDAPVIQCVQGGRPEAAWAADMQGLTAKDLAMQVVLPELDGRIGGILIGHKAEQVWHARTQCPLSAYAPDHDGIRRAAMLAANWARLRATPRAERRVAIVLANYPIRDGRLANGVGYDAPQSTVEILRSLAEAGYALAPLAASPSVTSSPPFPGGAVPPSPSPLRGGIEGGGRSRTIGTDGWTTAPSPSPQVGGGHAVPRDGNALIALLHAGPTNAHPERGDGVAFSLARYRELFAALPRRIRTEVTERWGDPSADPFCRSDGAEPAFHLPALRFGNVAVMLQPARGYHLDESASHHDPDLVPPHGYLAAYLWLRHEFAAHALVHNGKHGNLEWLPGKAVALDPASYPAAFWAELPHLYPFIVNDPGEGTQAKRRTGAVIVDHLVPPLTRAETYGPLRDLEALLDEYYAASGMDRRRLRDLRRRILDFARDAALDRDVALSGDEGEDLRRLDTFVCDLKEAQIRDGLHVFGRSPSGRQERDLIVALARVPRGEGPGAQSLIRALADDLRLGFDPLTADLGEAWRGPAIVAGALAPSPPSPLRGGTDGGGGPTNSGLSGWTPTPNPSPQGGGGQGGFALHGPRNIAVARKLRREATPPERVLWSMLRAFKTEGVHFRRQVPIGNHVADFACHHPKLIVELDGLTHFNDRAQYSDEHRTAYLQSRGYRVLRITNRDLATNRGGVWTAIDEALRDLAVPSPPSPLRGGIEGGGGSASVSAGGETRAEQAAGEWRESRTVGDVVEQLEELAAALVDGTRAPEPDWTATRAVLATVETVIRPRLRASGPAELRALLDGLDGTFVAPGPSGAPSRGRLDVLPTGRNFYSVDNRAVPTATAWELGLHSAEAVLRRHFQEHGTPLRSLVLSVWGTANMRTGGDDIAQALAFIGARPTWDPGSLRVSGYEIIPLAKLGRPRVDVTLRISGFFRDAFPAQIALFDRAVRAIGALDEPADENPIAARMRSDALGLMKAGESDEQAALRAGYRIFGSKPGAYGAGLQGLIDSGKWSSKDNLADAFLNWGQYAYGARSAGSPDRERFAARLSDIEAVVHNQDNREHDLLDSDDYYQFEGGLVAAAEVLTGRRPAAYHNDHSRPERPVARTLEEEVSRVMRARVVNPRWIDGVKRHGYKGAFEIIATVDYMFAFAATTGAVKTHHFDLAFEAYVESEATRDFIRENNRFGWDELLAKFREARDRGYWTPRSNSAHAWLESGPDAPPAPSLHAGRGLG